MKLALHIFLCLWVFFFAYGTLYAVKEGNMTKLTAIREIVRDVIAVALVWYLTS